MELALVVNKDEISYMNVQGGLRDEDGLVALK